MTDYFLWLAAIFLAPVLPRIFGCIVVLVLLSMYWYTK
jgi:hypothetical protein